MCALTRASTHTEREEMFCEYKPVRNRVPGLHQICQVSLISTVTGEVQLLARHRIISVELCVKADSNVSIASLKWYLRSC